MHGVLRHALACFLLALTLAPPAGASVAYPSRGAWQVTTAVRQALGGRLGAVMTAVDTDGTLWALPTDAPPVVLAQNLVSDGVITDLAWNPTRPELLLVRTMGDVRAGPYEQLVRLDLSSGAQAGLLPDAIGPQAVLTRPRYAPDGSWAYARVSCCAGSDVLLLDESGPHLVATHAFLQQSPDDQCRSAFDAALGATADGRLLIQITCFANTPAEQHTDFYLVPRDFSGGEQLGSYDGTPISWLGVSPDGARAFGIQSAEADEESLISVGIADGVAQVIESPIPTTLELAERSVVAADGRIAMGIGPMPPVWYPGADRLTSIAVISPDGSSIELPQAAYRDGLPTLTAFAWAPSSVLSMLSNQTAGPWKQLGPASGR